MPTLWWRLKTLMAHEAVCRTMCNRACAVEPVLCKWAPEPLLCDIRALPSTQHSQWNCPTLPSSNHFLPWKWIFSWYPNIPSFVPMCQVFNCVFQDIGTWNLCRGTPETLLTLRGMIWLQIYKWRYRMNEAWLDSLSTPLLGTESSDSGTAPPASPFILTINYCLITTKNELTVCHWGN